MEKEKYMISLTCEVLKMEKMKLSTTQKKSHRYRNLWLAESIWGGINWETGIDVYTAMYTIGI